MVGIAVATRLKAWRLSEGLTLEEVSGLTGVSVGMLSKVERGRTRMAPMTRLALARRLGVPVRQLFDPEPVALDEIEARGAGEIPE